MRVRTAGKLGYCFGVSQAIEKAVQHAEREGPLYSLGTLAHNEDVVEYLKQHGITPITQDELKQGMNAVITAHGAPPEVFNQVIAMNMEAASGKRIKWRKHTGLLDCTCPIVKKAQTVVSKKLSGFDIIIYGDPNHQEVIGLNGWAGGAKFIGGFNDLFTPEQDFKSLNLSRKIGIISQTTKVPSQFADFVTTLINRNIERLEEVRIVNTICPIVTQRIEDTRKLSEDVDIMLVVGSRESANTMNLADVAKPGVGANRVYIVQGPDQVAQVLSDWFHDEEKFAEMARSPAGNGGRALPRFGVTAGTSTPIEVVRKVVEVIEKVSDKIEEKVYGRKDSN